MAIFRERKGKKPGAVYPVFTSRQPTVIGRDESADVSLDDDRSSRRHARVVRAYGSWIIQDMKSSNGTLVAGEKIDKKRLEDGALVQIGNTLLQFHADEFAPPPSGEREGARLLETLREEEGCFVFRAYQSALDREVRVDQISSTRPVSEEIAAELATAVQAATRFAHDRVEPVVASDLDDKRGPFVVLRTKSGERLDAVLEDVLAATIGVRLAIFSSIAESVLARGATTILCGPLALEHIKLRTDGAPQAFVAGVELPTILSLRNGMLAHNSSYAPYLAPELGAGETVGGESLRAVQSYSLGAIGYHLLTGRTPMGDGKVRDILANHRALNPTPASLLNTEIPEPVSEILERMLAKEPNSRPISADEILGTLSSCDLPLDDVALASIDLGASESIDVDKPAIDDYAEPRSNVDRSPTRASLASNSPPTPGTSPPSTSPPSTSAPPPRAPAVQAREPIYERRRGGRSRTALNIVSLPIWAILWGGLFFGGWKLSKMLFETFLG